MTTTATKREWDLDEAIRLQGETNPDTGRPWSYTDLAARYGVSKAAVGKAVAAERERRQLGASPYKAERLLPWELPDWAHRDYTGVHLKVWAKNALLKRGESLSRLEAVQLEAFRVYLARQGEDTVVFFDRTAKRGHGAWVYRQRRQRETPTYGVCALRR